MAVPAAGHWALNVPVDASAPKAQAPARGGGKRNLKPLANMGPGSWLLAPLSDSAGRLQVGHGGTRRVEWPQ